MRSVIVHIGFNKTGSTSIQSWLLENRKYLAENKIFYDPFRFSNRYLSNYHAEICACLSEEIGEFTPSFNTRHTLRLESREDQKRLCAEFLPQYRAAIRQVSEGRFIISSEHILTCINDMDEARRMAGFLKQDFDKITIIAYIRRQEDWIPSHYSQLAKAAPIQPLDAFVKENPVKDFDHHLSLFEEVFGRENVIVRLTAPDLLDGKDLVEDFCFATGISYKPSTATVGALQENQSPSAAAIEILRRFASEQPYHINRTYPNPYFRDLRIALETLDKGYSRPRLSEAQRDYVRASNADSNERIRSKHFPERTELFPGREADRKEYDLSCEVADLSAELLKIAAEKQIWNFSIRDRFELWRHRKASAGK